MNKKVLKIIIFVMVLLDLYIFIFHFMDKIIPNKIKYLILIGLIFLIIIIVFLKNILEKNSNERMNNITYGEFDFGPAGKKLPKDKDINYFRDIPCNKNLLKMFWICSKYEIIPEENLRKGLIEAILLKWVKEHKIKVSNAQNSLFNLKDNNYIIDLTKMINIESLEKIPIAEKNFETELIKILKWTTKNNEILEKNEFNIWYNNNKYVLDAWFYNINTQVVQELIDEGLITTYKKQYRDLFFKEFKTIKKIDSKIREEAINIVGFKKFITDFGISKEKKIKNVHIWEEYLIFASLLGIANKVEEQFSNLIVDFDDVS